VRIIFLFSRETKAFWQCRSCLYIFIVLIKEIFTLTTLRQKMDEKRIGTEIKIYRVSLVILPRICLGCLIFVFIPSPSPLYQMKITLHSKMIYQAVSEDIESFPHSFSHSESILLFTILVCFKNIYTLGCFLIFLVRGRFGDRR
jgi:hypothetical protein